VQTFNALVGVYLQAVPEEFCGNLVVFPGSHSLVADATRQPSTMDLLRREGTFSLRHHFAHAAHTPAGMAALHEKLPIISKPLQIIAEAGDVLVAHSSLPHSVAPNISSAIRYALYFRVNSSSRCSGCKCSPLCVYYKLWCRDMRVIGDDDPDPSLVMCDLWHHWQPVASLASRMPCPPPADVPEVRILCGWKHMFWRCPVATNNPAGHASNRRGDCCVV
jgi:hypothetical protein